MSQNSRNSKLCHSTKLKRSFISINLPDTYSSLLSYRKNMLQNSGRLIAFVVLLIVCGAHSFSAHAQAVGSVFEKDGIKYKITSLAPNTAAVTSKEPRYTGAINIPATVNADGGETFSVTTIGSYVFWQCSDLTAVTIPNSVTTIGTNAFGNCSGLSAFTVTDGNPSYCSQDGVLFNKAKTELIQYPMAKVGLSYEIPTSVTTLGAGAFKRCGGLTTVVIPNSVTKIGVESFFECIGLTSVTIPHSVTIVGDRAFESCDGLTSVIIPNSMTTIGERAFCSCDGLISVTIPHSVTTIKFEAFAYCSGLTAFMVEDDNPNYSSQDGVLFNKSKTELIQYPLAKAGTCYEISNSVITIGSSAFAACRLTSIIIPNSVKTIGNNSFSHCIGLTSVLIPNSVITIGISSFSYCFGLTSITIPNSVTSLGYWVFNGCSALTHIYSLIEDVAKVSMGSSVFSGVSLSTCKLKVPAGKQTAYKAAAQWKDFTNIEEFQVYNISVAASVTNGTVTSVPNTTVTEGLEVALTTMPNAGFKLKDGSLKAYKTGDETVTVAIANQKFIMPSYDVTVAAEFVLATGFETAIAETIVLSPNPASEFLYIKGLATRTQVDIYSVTGVLVLSVKAEPEQPISLGALKSGLYLVEVNGKTYRLVKR